MHKGCRTACKSNGIALWMTTEVAGHSTVDDDRRHSAVDDDRSHSAVDDDRSHSDVDDDRGGGA